VPATSAPRASTGPLKLGNAVRAFDSRGLAKPHVAAAFAPEIALRLA